MIIDPFPHLMSQSAARNMVDAQIRFELRKMRRQVMKRLRERKKKECLTS